MEKTWNGTWNTLAIHLVLGIISCTFMTNSCIDSSSWFIKDQPLRLRHIFMPPMSWYSLLQIILWWCHSLLVCHTYRLRLLEFLFYLVSDKAVWIFFSKYVRLSSIPLPSHLLVYTVSVSCLITSTDLDWFSLDTFPSLPNLWQQH